MLINSVRSGLQSELSSLRDKSAQLDGALKQAANSQNMVVELESLRVQLSEVCISNFISFPSAVICLLFYYLFAFFESTKSNC